MNIIRPFLYVFAAHLCVGALGALLAGAAWFASGGH